MTNFDFYNTMLAEDIEHYENDMSMDSMEILKEIFKEGSYCVFTENDQTYVGKFVKWLRQEYNPPIELTQLEKDILESLDDKFEYIKKIDCDNIMVLEGTELKGGNIAYYFDVRFDGLERNKKYKIQDIIANCKVVVYVGF